MPQFLDSLALAPDIEVVIAALPEMHTLGEQSVFRFIREQVDVFRHHHVTVHAHRKTPARYFQLAQQDAACLGRVQPWLATVATEGDEVKLAALLETSQAPRHD